PRSAGVRGGRAARARLPRRDRLPLHPPEPPPLRVLHHVRLPRLPLARRVRGGALRERPRHRGRHARAADQHLRAHALQLLLPLGAPPGGRDPRLLLVQRPGARPSLGVAGRERAQRAPHGLRLDQLRRGVRGRPLRAPGRRGRHRRPAASMTDRYESHTYDVLVVGAGGAGLRAAIEAAAEGCSVGLVCKSLLGKAHTVMAEGGVAAALAYRRDTGRFIVFRTKAVVLATGGIGRAYKVNSNSWEYTGDGQALAYEAGADLMGMEFVQFHPTGMVWPLSVRGILITEG